MNQSGLAHRRTHLRWGTLAATIVAFVGLSACQPTLPGDGDGGAPTSALAGSTWIEAHLPEQPTAGVAFDVGSTVLPTRGAVDDLVLAQTFPAGVAVERVVGWLEAWDPTSGELVQQEAACNVAGQVTICAFDGTIDAAWAIDRLEIRATVTAPAAGDLAVVLDASATDPTGADPTPIHKTTTFTVAP